MKISSVLLHQFLIQVDADVVMVVFEVFLHPQQLAKVNGGPRRIQLKKQRINY